MQTYSRRKKVPFRIATSVLLGITAGLAGHLNALAATANVSIVNFAFNPATVTINVNDQVKWTWASGATSHSTTSDTSLWDSGLHTNGFTFSHTFGAAGNFPYFCSLHPFMTASVTVQAGNAPPSVSITAPTNGSTFVAPWTGTLRASASDSDGTVSKVDFFAGATLLGTVTSPGATLSLGVTNLAAGNYTLTAVATDNGGAQTTSTGVGIQVLQPAPITLSSPQHLASGVFQFKYTATPGLSYVIRRSGGLPVFTPIATNAATQNPETFQDASPPGGFNFYSIHVLPNP